ncbi:uncharacterized protein LOC135107698 isoform X1 [Scylla paramamosain]|uniref:uncharacterized protein LOC135107698 isoform X1 n=1 Tax=Scylla paramamosain TaxID=85552 RepID=UPI003083206B
MKMVPTPAANAASANMGLKITLTVFGSFGLAIWGTSIGFMLGWNRGNVLMLAGLAEYVSIIANAGMIYVTCRIMFLIMNSSFPGGTSLQDLQQCVARLVAFTVLGFTTWVTSIVWLAQNPNMDESIVYHACNYGFVISSVVAGLAGGLLRITYMIPALPAGSPKYTVQQQGHYVQSHQGSQSQYNNPAYTGPYSQHRM